jgi:flagellar biosynthesis/type III secretory pathway chaperone
MNSSGMVKRMLEWKKIGSLRTESQRVRRLEDVCSDVKVINVKNRKILALNWKAWNNLVEKAKTHKGL